ncbi:hypothetical protein V8C44DRAFT_327878 [Trichoderma aethiopicum]
MRGLTVRYLDAWEVLRKPLRPEAPTSFRFFFLPVPSRCLLVSIAFCTEVHSMLVISCLVTVTLHTWMLLLLLLLCRPRLNGFLLRRHSTLRTTTYYLPT